MKTFLTLFVLFFSSTVVAEVGDKYFCKKKYASQTTLEGVERYKLGSTFSFEWKEEEIVISNDDNFSYVSPEILWGMFEIFYAVHYKTAPSSMQKIPVKVWTFNNGTLMLSNVHSPNWGEQIISECKKL